MEESEVNLLSLRYHISHAVTKENKDVKSIDMLEILFFFE